MKFIGKIFSKSMFTYHTVFIDILIVVDPLRLSSLMVGITAPCCMELTRVHTVGILRPTRWRIIILEGSFVNDGSVHTWKHFTYQYQVGSSISKNYIIIIIINYLINY